MLNNSKNVFNPARKFPTKKLIHLQLPTCKQKKKIWIRVHIFCDYRVLKTTRLKNYKIITPTRTFFSNKKPSFFAWRRNITTWQKLSGANILNNNMFHIWMNKGYSNKNGLISPLHHSFYFQIANAIVWKKKLTNSFT